MNMSKHMERAQRLQKRLFKLDVKVVQAIERGQQSSSIKDRARAARMAQQINQICAELGAESVVKMQDELRLAEVSEEMLDGLELILEQETRAAVDRLVESWRLLREQESITH